MENDLNKLWNLSFEIESLLFNLAGKQGETYNKGMNVLDEKVSEFNSLYMELREYDSTTEEVTEDEKPDSAAEEWIEETVESVPEPDDNDVSEIEVAVEEIKEKVEDAPEPDITSEKIPEPEKKEEKEIIADARQEIKPQNKSSISRLFTLNDRFLFTRELFGGSSEQYTQALSLIESMPSYDIVEDYFINDLGWDKENSEVKLFCDIVKRYFRE